MNPNIDTGTDGMLRDMQETQLSRVKRVRELFTNAPAASKCKICQAEFANPIYEGKSVCVVTCQGCRDSMLGRKAIKDKGSLRKKQQQRADAIIETRANLTSEALPIPIGPIMSLRSFGGVV